MTNKTSKDLYVTGEHSVVQDNKLIEEKPSMSVFEHKLFSTLVASINYKDDQLYDLDVSLKNVISLWGADPKNAYSQIKAALVGLSKKQFQIETTDMSGKRTVEGSSYISSYKYREGSSVVHITISKVFAPYLLSLKSNYTTYLLENTLELKTSHAIRTYELLAQFRGLGKRTFSVEEYKKKLGIADKYKGNNSNLKIRVLNPVCEEISARTDLTVAYKMTGSGPLATIEFAIIIKEPLSGAKGKIRKRISNGDIDMLVGLLERETDMDKVFSKEQIRRVAEYSMERSFGGADVSLVFMRVNNAFHMFLIQSVGRQIDNPWGYFLKVLDSYLEEKSV